MKYWIGVVNKNHVEMGVEQGIMQLGHGKRGPLARLKKGDWLIYYSPAVDYQDKNPLQAFTALGQVADEQIYQFKVSDDFTPFRRKVNYLKVKDLPIRPLIDDLGFIKNKKSWGYVLRFGLVEIPQKDFELIRDLMVNV